MSLVQPEQEIPERDGIYIYDSVVAIQEQNSCVISPKMMWECLSKLDN